MSLTTNQARDALLEVIPLNTAMVRELKNHALEATEKRKQDAETYFHCPRCYGEHSVRGNFDNLCDGCVKTILEHFPEHESVPLITAALAWWVERR